MNPKFNETCADKAALLTDINQVMKDVGALSVMAKELHPDNHAHFKINAAWRSLDEARKLLR